jgi:light-regulated signal transduction histidine kinase (bacteriophytochrome)
MRTAEVWPRYFAELKEMGRRTFESVLLARDGKEIPVEISSTCLLFGNEMYCCSIARDISARREAARELERYAAELERANESLRHRNRELDEFAHLASHDLKEPLRAILTFSQLLEQDLGGRLPSDARRDLEFITNSAGRMQQLINDLLALSRAGRADMRQSAVPLRRCVDAALEALSIRISETGAEIMIGELPEVTGDATMLTQLYQNLTGNALKFIVPGRPPRIQIVADQNENGWLFTVEDNGLGIKPEYLEKIFQPFRRLHAGPEHEGTGIGLAICRKVVERHGGRIWADSHPGEGSRFHFTIGEATGV